MLFLFNFAHDFESIIHCTHNKEKMTKFIHQRLSLRLIQLSIILAGIISFSSCVDDHYDIHKIDSTIGVGGDDFSLFGNNTTNGIPLEDIFDIENSRFVHVAENGEYYLTGTNSTPFVMASTIDPVSISSSITREKEIVIDLEDFSEKEQNARARRVRKELTIERTIASLEYETTNIPEIIDELDYVYTDATMHMKMVFNDNVTKVIKKMAELKITMPVFIDVENVVFEGQELTMDEDHTIILKDVVPPEKGFAELTITLKGMNLKKKDTNNYIIFEKGKRLYAKGEVVISGTMKLEDVNVFYLEPPYIFSALCTAEMSDTKITGCIGKFDINYNRDQLGKLIINQYPYFLDDPDVRLKLYDPHVNLNYTNDLPIDGLVSGRLVATDRYKNQFASMEVPPFVMKGQGSGVISLRRVPAESRGDTTVVVIPNITDIINILPCKVELLDVKITNNNTGPTSLKFGHEYSSTSYYELNNSLSLAEGAQIVHNDTLKQLHDWVKDLRFEEKTVNGKRKIEGYVQMDADVENKVPAHITITAHGIDANGDSISTERLKFTVNRVVPASHDGITPTECHIIIIGEATDNDVFKILDQIKFHMIGSANDENGQNPVVGIPINAYTQTIRLKNVIIKKHGKIIGDFN